MTETTNEIWHIWTSYRDGTPLKALRRSIFESVVKMLVIEAAEYVKRDDHDAKQAQVNIVAADFYQNLLLEHDRWDYRWDYTPTHRSCMHDDDELNYAAAEYLHERGLVVREVRSDHSAYWAAALR